MLTTVQKRAFADDGYVVARDLVGEAHRARALARIDELLRTRPVPDGHTGHHFYFEHAEAEPELMQLLVDTSLFETVQAMVTPLELLVPPQVQVALTFPPFDHMPGRGHIDGLTPREDDGRPGTFTVLAGVVLSNQSRDFTGNLVVWPGTHLQLAAHLREIGLAPYLDSAGHPPADHRNPVQVHAAPGDVILASYPVY